ncbi:MAG: hypothetical protein R2861_07075 [Desulfobacterales bacterium]
MEFKLNVDGPDAGMETDETLAETRELLTTIKNKIKSINTQINGTQDHLGRITRVFENPAAHLLTLKRKPSAGPLRASGWTTDPRNRLCLFPLPPSIASERRPKWLASGFASHRFLKKPA